MSDATPTIGTEEFTAELLPPEGHPKLGYKIFALLDEILKDKDRLGLPQKWNRFYELGKNKHWKTGTNKASLISANLCFTHRKRTVNLLTDNNPTFNVSRVGSPNETDPEIYDKLLHTAQFWWTEQEQQAVLEKSVINGETYGCTIEKSLFNPELEFGLGEVETETIDPFNFGVYPVKCQDIQKAEAVLHFRPMTVREVRRRWPEKAAEIKPDTEYLKELGDERREIIGGKPNEPKGYLSTFAGIVKSMLNIAGGDKNDSDELLVVECWVKDYTGIPDEQTGLELYKYPGCIRCVTTCNGGRVVLEDKPNPSINPALPEEKAQKTYLYDKFPFSLTPSVVDTANPWGMSDYEQLEVLQMELNKTLSQITLLKDKASRLKIINPKDSGVPNSAFTNYPGVINPNNSMVAQAIRYMDPPEIPSDLVNTIGIYKDFFFLVAGTFDLESAQVPGREVIAYKAIAALIEQAATMLRGKIRGYSKMIRERGRMYLSHVMNWYTEERWITATVDGKENQLAIKGQDLIIPAKLSVVSGSTMPVSKIQTREEAIGLFEKGAIDKEELLKTMEWPDWKNVVKRLNSGVFGALFEKLGAIGVPQPVLDAFNEIAGTEDKDFEKLLKKGALPSFPQLLAASTAQGGSASPTEPPPSLLDQAEAKVKEAEVDKVKAEIELIQEQINTQRVEQQVKLAGIEYDKQMLVIERAKAASGIEKGKAETDRNRTEPISEKPTAAGDKKRPGPPKFYRKRNRVYNERGLKSNNQTEEANP